MYMLTVTGKPFAPQSSTGCNVAARAVPGVPRPKRPNAAPSTSAAALVNLSVIHEIFRSVHSTSEIRTPKPAELAPGRVSASVSGSASALVASPRRAQQHQAERAQEAQCTRRGAGSDDGTRAAAVVGRTTGIPSGHTAIRETAGGIGAG